MAPHTTHIGDEDDKDIPAGTFHGGEDEDIPAGTFHA